MTVDQNSNRAEALQSSLTPFHYENHIIYSAVIGSRAYGLARRDSDTDVRGVFLPPAEKTWSLNKPSNTYQTIKDGTDIVYWEIEFFLRLALKANPNVLEVLWTPVVEYTTPLFDELLAIRGKLLSRNLIPTYLGYVTSQLNKMSNRLGPDTNDPTTKTAWKHAMHLIRLLLAGTHALNDGAVLVQITDPATLNMLRNIRAGLMPIAEFHALRLELEDKFKQAAARQLLPPEPDYEAANDFLIKARRSVVGPN